MRIVGGLDARETAGVFELFVVPNGMYGKSLLARVGAPKELAGTTDGFLADAGEAVGVRNKLLVGMGL